MIEILQFAVLGLGSGAVYALLTQGIVLTYRASGVVNFAHGAFAMVGAFAFYEARKTAGLSWTVSLIVAAAFAALIGAASYLLVQRPLRHASLLTRVIGTLGVLTVLQAAATLIYHDRLYAFRSPFPARTHVLAGLVVPEDRLWMLAVAVVLSALIYVLGRYTRFGLATTAIAENERAASALGWSPTALGAGNWAIGGALAAVAGVLVVPITQLTVHTLGALLVPTLAIALVAGFRSIPIALGASLALGIAQSLTVRYVAVPGVGDAIPLVVIVAVLVLRGRSLPVRGVVIDRLPALGAGRVRPLVLAAVTVAAVLVVQLLPPNWQAAVGTSAVVALMLLSLVVVSGYAGQLSLAQYALGGIGALVTGQLVVHGWPFVLAALIGIVATVLVGLIFAIPAVRARGFNLAIVTLGLGFATTVLVFNRSDWTGGAAGLPVGSQTLFGVPLDAALHPGSQAAVVIVAFAACAWLVVNVRRGRTGRRLISVRTNERAAASLGVNVRAVKLYAFALAAAIAAIAGILLAFSGQAVLYSQTFDPTFSITAGTLSVLGGIGYILGPIFGSTLATGGFPGGLIANALGDGGDWLVLIGGLVLLVMLVLEPDGLAAGTVRTAAFIRSRLWPRGQEKRLPALPTREKRGRAATESVLKVHGLTVRFGGVTALDKVDITVRSGEVLGLIGPNGAGKTTLIDAITGFVKPAAGSITLDGNSLDGVLAYQRARAGLTRSFQSLELFDDVSVLDNLRAAADPRDAVAYALDLVHPAAPPLSPVVVEAIHEFGLTADLERRPDELSYGKRRLVAIARAVATDASILLLDEPAAGLSETESQELGRLIRRLADEWGLGVLLIEHDVSVVMSTCDRVAVLDFGRKIADGAPADVQHDPVVVAAYLGDAAEDGPAEVKSGG